MKINFKEKNIILNIKKIMVSKVIFIIIKIYKLISKLIFNELSNF